jgi:hypothetical protein
MMPPMSITRCSLLKKKVRKAVFEVCDLFSALYTDRGSHYWTTPEAGGKVDKVNLTQFGGR